MKNKTSDKLPETLSWKAPSHQQVRRSNGWYLGFILVSIGLIIFGIYSHSLLMIITFVLIILVMFIVSIQPPRMVTYKATTAGISIGATSYAYNIIKTFWITYEPPQVKTLNSETTAYLNNRVIIELGEQDPTELKFYLNQYLTEDLDRTESFRETLARNLKI